MHRSNEYDGVWRRLMHGNCGGQSYRTFWLALLCATLLAGCGKAVILKEDAEKVSLAAKTTVAASRTFYSALAESRRNYLISVLAAEQSCRFNSTFYLMTEDSYPNGLRCPTEAEKSEYNNNCLTEPKKPLCSKYKGKMQIYSLSDLERSSALLLVDQIAEYQVLLAKIVEDPKFDSKAELEALQARVNQLSELIGGLQGADVPALDFAPQIAAAGALFDLIRQAANASNDLAALKLLLSGPDATRFDAALTSLILRYESLDRNAGILFDRADLARRAQRLNDAWTTLSEEKRISAMREIAAAEVALGARVSAPDALAELFKALRKSHQQLRAAIVDGVLTEEQRRRIAQENLRQLKAWFDAIRGLIAVF